MNFVAVRSDQRKDLPPLEEYYQARGFQCPGCCEYLFFAPHDVPAAFIEVHRRQARDRCRRNHHPNHPPQFEEKFDPNLTA